MSWIMLIRDFLNIFGTDALFKKNPSEDAYNNWIKRR